MWLWILGCVQPEPEARDTASAAEPEETGQPVDTGDPAPVEPCPFAGSWLLLSLNSGGLIDFLEGSGANMTGTAELCEWDLVLVQEGCRQRELAVIEAQPFGVWTGWNDGAPEIEPAGCTLPGGPEEIRPTVALSADGQRLEITYNSWLGPANLDAYRFERN